MKTERIVLRTTPEFKAFLAREARREKVSVAELVKRRFQPSAEERELAALIPVLRRSLRETRAAVRRSIETAAKTNEILRRAREERST